jgi:hypothetical protein
MGQPLEGVKPMRKVSITVDGDEWDKFLDNMETKMPPLTSRLAVKASIQKTCWGTPW